MVLSAKCHPSTQHACPSTDGRIIAAVDHSRLILRSPSKSVDVRTIDLGEGFPSGCRFLRWSRPHQRKGSESDVVPIRPRSRVLLADDELVHIYDADDRKWHAVITNPSGSIGKVAAVEFGHTLDEILIFTDFGVKLTIWSLITSRGVEIRDPKFTSRGYGYRPGSGHMAILTRQAAHDVVMLLAPGTHELIESFASATVDAQGLKWSPDGRWLAIWEAASMGFKVLLYTADGHLFRTYGGGQDADTVGLGVRSVEWSGNGWHLFVGGYDGRITVLGGQSLSPIASIEHATTISFSHAPLWQEQIDASHERTYVPASPPVCPPTPILRPTKPIPKASISILAASSDSTYLATRCDASPTTVWVWSLKTFTPATVLIHHSPVKKLEWHPTVSGLLMIHCITEDPVVHLWSAEWEVPITRSVSLERKGGRTEASWLYSSNGEKPRFLFCNALNYALRYASVVEEQDEAEETSFTEGGALGPEDMFDEGNSMDLSPIKLSQDMRALGIGDGFTGDGLSELGCLDDVDDTFRYRLNAVA